MLLSWSSGKDSIWALRVLRQRTDVVIEGLFTTINEQSNRVAMHGVRTELVKEQAKKLQLPIEIIPLPFPCSNEDYERITGSYFEAFRSKGITTIAFGDLFLGDVRAYREKQLEGTGLEAMFPIWGQETGTLARQMIHEGTKAIITCADSKQIPEAYSGQLFDEHFIDSLPPEVDRCGEQGEFHTFVYDTPLFTSPISIQTGEQVERDGFVFTDVKVAPTL